MIPRNLTDLEHFRADPRVKFKEETVDGVEVIIPVYMIADAQFWDIPYARELRGHTYLKETGELVGVAFHKFFNVGEREETQQDKIDWEKISFATEKLDGSMINPVVINGKVWFKTKKSFYSDVAKTFTDWFWKQDKCLIWEKDIINIWYAFGASPIFEFFHPEWQIVLNYGAPKIWVLSTRSIQGNYINMTSFSSFLKDMHKPNIFKELDVLNLAKTIENEEGWVIYNHSINEFYKVKTQWYLKQHRVRTEMRERDVAEMAAQELLDDVKSLVSASGLDLSKIEKIEKSVSDDISKIRVEVEKQVDLGIGAMLDAKSMALKCKGSPYFGLIMRSFKGGEPDYKEYFIKYILKDNYKLNCVYNEKF